MPDRKNCDLVGIQPIEDTVIPITELSNLLTTYLRNDTPSLRRLLEALDEVKESGSPILGNHGPIPGDVIDNLIDPLESERQPEDSQRFRAAITCALALE